MSGFWLKWEKGLTRKPEIMQIAARLMIPPTQAAGSLMLVMEWLDDAVTNLSRDGHADVPLGALQSSFIDGISGISGFAEALAEVGWVSVKDNVLTFVNVGKHNGTSAKSRALANERKRKERSRSSHDNVTVKTRPICSVSDSESIYQEYPKKVGHGAAIKSIDRALIQKSPTFLLERTKAYAAAVKLWPSSEKQFIPHPSTWFNQQRYDDDPETWKRTANAGQPNGNSRQFSQRNDYSKITNHNC